jgi:hypothetical protein
MIHEGRQKCTKKYDIAMKNPDVWRWKKIISQWILVKKSGFLYDEYKRNFASVWRNE